MGAWRVPARQLALQRSAEDQRGNAKNNDEQVSEEKDNEEKDKNGKATEGIDNEGKDNEGRDNKGKDNDEQNNCAPAAPPATVFRSRLRPGPRGHADTSGIRQARPAARMARPSSAPVQTTKYFNASCSFVRRFGAVTRWVTCAKK